MNPFLEVGRSSVTLGADATDVPVARGVTIRNSREEGDCLDNDGRFRQLIFVSISNS